MTNIQCNITECMYNENYYCQCEEIKINYLVECDTFEIGEDESDFEEGDII